MSERTGVSAATLSKWIRGKKVTAKSNFTRLHIGTVSDIPSDWSTQSRCDQVKEKRDYLQSLLDQGS